MATKPVSFHVKTQLTLCNLITEQDCLCHAYRHGITCTALISPASLYFQHTTRFVCSDIGNSLKGVCQTCHAVWMIMRRANMLMASWGDYCYRLVLTWPDEAVLQVFWNGRPWFNRKTGHDRECETCFTEFLRSEQRNLPLGLEPQAF